MAKFALVLLSATATVLQAGSLVAQTTPLPGASSHGGSDTSIFAPLTLLPAPSATRTARGAPGPKYWQNSADYDLHATLDTVAHMIHSTMTLRYTNHSPDTLTVLWFQVGGFQIDSIAQVVGRTTVPLVLRDNEKTTDIKLAQVTLTHPLAPGQSAIIKAAWSGGIIGVDNADMLYEAEFWYPPVCVYDDVTGWNLSGLEGGYGEYGDIALAITVPARYIVAATGTLVNPREVLTPTEITRLAQAAKSPTPIAIVTGDELRTGAARPTQTGMLTWRFRATRVFGPAWAAAPDYQWDATSWHGILAQSYYRASANAVFGHGEGADQVRMSIQEYSERWILCPYPQISAVEGPEGGTTYTMLSLVGNWRTLKTQYHVVTHEVGHNWFPYLVGANEPVHAWMSEGFDTFINSLSEARRYPPHDPNAFVSQMVFRGRDRDSSSMGAATLEAWGADYNPRAQYFKTGYVLQLLRRDVLGPEVFDKAFRVYIQRWVYKHPTPMDFFRTMEDVSGRKLEWFWRECFLEAPRFDQAIDSVHQTIQGTKTHVTVTYGNKGRAVLPLLVRFTFSDSTTQTVTYPADVWRANPTTYTVSYTFPNKTVSRLVLDPDTHLPDADRSNNVWAAK